MFHISQGVIPSPRDLRPFSPGTGSLLPRTQQDSRLRLPDSHWALALHKKITCSHANEMEAAEKEKQQVSRVICVKLQRKSRSRKIGVKKWSCSYYLTCWSIIPMIFMVCTGPWSYCHLLLSKSFIDVGFVCPPKWKIPRSLGKIIHSVAFPRRLDEFHTSLKHLLIFQDTVSQHHVEKRKKNEYNIAAAIQSLITWWILSLKTDWWNFSVNKSHFWELMKN